MNVKSWTDEEIVSAVDGIRLGIRPDPDSAVWDTIAATLCELIDLRAKTVRLDHESQTMRAELDLARALAREAAEAAKAMRNEEA